MKTTLDISHLFPMASPRRLVRALVCLILVIPLTATAFDGRIDVRGTSSEGRSGNEAFDTSTFRVDSSIEQYVRLSKTFFIRADYRNQYEENESSSSSFSSAYSSWTHLPSLALTHRSHTLRGGISLDGFRRDYDGANFGERQDERLDFSAWLQLTRHRYDASLRFSDTTTDRTSVIGVTTESRDRAMHGRARRDLADFGDLQYSGSFNRNRSLTSDITRDRMNHGLRLQGSGGWNEQRGRFTLEARTDYFSESITTSNTTARARLVPFFMGFVLDDSPENLDPLEDQPTPLPELSDYDRDTPTSLNIGDDAAPVREYGGDYRNLVVDLGEPQAVGSAALYVDRIVRFPEFMRWELYTSDDPEGIDWTPAPLGTMTATYTEWVDGRQGWEFTFSEPLTARRFKFVDVKSGPTEPVIFLNELELYDPVQVDEMMTETSTLRHRITGSLRYDMTDRWTVGYRTTLTRRDNEGDDNDLTGAIHSFDSVLRFGGWRYSAIYSLNTLESQSRQNTNTRTLNMALASDTARPLWTRLTWHHGLDRSLERDKTTDDMAIDVTWQAAPALTFTQKVGHGILDDEFYGLSSRSWFSVSVLRSQPKPNLTLDLRRSSRWVNQEAGAEFTNFNDTDGIVRWTIFPLLSYSGQVRYETRDDDELLWRHVLSWNPLSTGSMDMRLSLNRYSDTRTDTEQQGGSIDVIWRARPRLKFEGRLETQDYDRNGVKSTPFNTQYRVTWTF